MRAVFVDTSAWDALEDSSDSNHAVAVRYRTILRQERMPLAEGLSALGCAGAPEDQVL